jgi:tRNA A37 threonylcarbamoyltransferase TsaD
MDAATALVVAGGVAANAAIRAALSGLPPSMACPSSRAPVALHR